MSEAGPRPQVQLDTRGVSVRLDCRRASRPLMAQLMLITDGVSWPGGGGARPGTAELPTELGERLGAVLGAAAPGAVMVQLRNHDTALGVGGLYRLALALRELTARFGAPLLVNDRMDVALAVAADGVHIPARGLPTRAARRAADAAGRGALYISAATHSLSEARMAAAGGADCVTLGPIWPTPSKPQGAALPAGAERVTLLGPQLLATAAKLLPIPVFGLGGIDTPERAATCRAAGARVAVLRAVLGAAEPAAALRQFLGSFSDGNQAG